MIEARSDRHPTQRAEGAPAPADPEPSAALALPASPQALVRREVLRAIGGLLAAPMHGAGYLLRRRTLRAELLQDLSSSTHPADPDPVELPRVPLRIFLSCAEPSGETHAVSLARSLRSVAEAWGAPPPLLFGLGGERLAAADVRTIGNPVARAAMGGDALRSIGFYRGLLEATVATLAKERIDVCVPVDSPALHVPLGHLARRLGIPVVHHITPQYWGWAPWRVDGYRSAVDLALTILPFEPAWFERHGVRSAHIGHPQLDALGGIPSPGWGIDDGRSARRSLVLLPGSRRSVIERNLPFFLRVLSRLRRGLETGATGDQDLEVVLPLASEDLRSALGPLAHENTTGVRVSTAPLHTELAHARIALSVSGTVLLDLLHHRIPTSVVYPARTLLQRHAQNLLLTVPWFASPNLLAGRAILPETVHHDGEPAQEVAAGLRKWLGDPCAHARTRADLDLAASRLGPSGATQRAAAHVLRAAVGELPPRP